MPVATDLENHDLLIVSDLHLSGGRDPVTKKLSVNEDFLFDEEFARFLEYHMHRMPGRDPGRKWHLMINGDFLDFLQVTSTEINEDSLDHLSVKASDLSYDPGHRNYGFGCGAPESVFKLWKIMDGHWQFFEALAEFVAEGHVVTIGRGNHDVEFIYPEVQAAFAPKLRRIYADKLHRLGDLDAYRRLDGFEASAQRIRFIDWFYYEKNAVWVEHGNQYEGVNSFKYWLAPFLPDIPRSRRKGEIDLPWGSFFVRYLFNKIERKRRLPTISSRKRSSSGGSSSTIQKWRCNSSSETVATCWRKWRVPGEKCPRERTPHLEKSISSACISCPQHRICHTRFSVGWTPLLFGSAMSSVNRREDGGFSDR